jgi:hypothetical protein
MFHVERRAGLAPTDRLALSRATRYSASPFGPPWKGVLCRGGMVDKHGRTSMIEIKRLQLTVAQLSLSDG